jgi:hypothetical protein
MATELRGSGLDKGVDSVRKLQSLGLGHREQQFGERYTFDVAAFIGCIPAELNVGSSNVAVIENDVKRAPHLIARLLVVRRETLDDVWNCRLHCLSIAD